MSTQKQGEVNWKLLLICIAIGAVIWFIPAPSGLETDAWHLFSIFVATIVALVIKPIPMGSTAILALTVIALTQILTLEQSLSGDMPLTVVTGGNQPDHTAESWEHWMSFQKGLAALSSNSRHVILEDAGHAVHIDNPEAVILEIRKMHEASKQVKEDF